MERLTWKHHDGGIYADMTGNAVEDFEGVTEVLSGDVVNRLAYYEDLAEQGRMVTFPLYAKIYDFNEWTHSEEDIKSDNGKEYIVRKVDQIEFANKRHDYDVVWYNDGLTSYSFKLVPEMERLAELEGVE